MSHDISLSTFKSGYHQIEDPDTSDRDIELEAADASELEIIERDDSIPRKARRREPRTCADLLLVALALVIGGLVCFAAVRVVSLSSELETRPESTPKEEQVNSTPEPSETVETDRNNGTFLIHFHSQPEKNQETAPSCPIPIAYTDNEEIADAQIWAADGYQGLFQEERDELRVTRPNQSQVIWASEAAPNRGSLMRYFDSLRYNASYPLYDADMTYRLNGSVPGTYAYGYMNFSNPAVPWESKRQDKIAVAFITNCHPRNARTLLLQELMALLPGQIDSFGSCKNNGDSTSSLRKLGHLEEAGPNPSRWNIKITTINYYKFTIAFENSNDLDYVTEKYYQPLERGSIPLVFGAPDMAERFYPSLVPPAAIDVGQYLSAELTALSTTRSEAPTELSMEDKRGIARLAARLQYLSSEEGRSEYESMLAWKKDDAWKTESPLGKIVALNEGEARDCKLAGILRGQEWAKSTWTEPGFSDDDDTRRK